MDWNNTPSTSIYVVPNCGLSIEVAKDADERLSFDNAEPRDVYEQNNYNQNLLFTAIHIQDEDLAILMLTKLIRLLVRNI